MKSFKGVIILIIIIIALLAVVFGRNRINSAYRNTDSFFASITGSSVKYNDLKNLTQENEQLKIKIKELEKRELFNKATAKVYSRYPFNDKERLIIDTGRIGNINQGDPVTTTGGFLIGKIISINGGQAEVATIFDPEWKSSVAVDSAEYKAVLKGGQPPKLELLSKESEIKEGDPVFNIAPDYPYRQLIGEIMGIGDVPGEIWRIASVKVPYNIDKITKVEVITNFPE